MQNDNTPAIPQHPKPFFRLFPVMVKAVLIFLVVLVIFAGIVFAAFRSQPGDTFYEAKGMLELFGENAQVNGVRASTYQVSLMERRLNEVKILSKQESLKTGAIDDLHKRLTSHLTSMTEIVSAQNNGLSHEDALVSLNRFASVAGAIETISENTPVLETYGEQAEDIRADSVKLYKAKVDRFVESATLERIYTYIQEQLTEVSTQLDDQSLSAETLDDAENYIDRVIVAMKDSDFPKAITAIAEASRFIQIEKYSGIFTPAPTHETATSTKSQSTSSQLITPQSTTTQ